MARTANPEARRVQVGRVQPETKRILDRIGARSTGRAVDWVVKEFREEIIARIKLRKK